MENSLENLTQYILNAANSEAQELLKAALENAKMEHSQVENHFALLLSQQKEQLESQSNQRIQNALKQHEDKLKKERTRFALQLIDQLFDEAEKMLCNNTSPDLFLNFYRNSFSNLNLAGDCEVILGGNTAKTISGDMRTLLELKTEKYTVHISEETIPGQGGFLLEQPPVEYSFLFSDLLSEIKQKEAPILLKQLMD